METLDAILGRNWPIGVEPLLHLDWVKEALDMNEGDLFPLWDPKVSSALGSGFFLTYCFGNQSV